MYAGLLADATFHDLLLACDRDLADAARAGRCRLCGGVLHSATYPRKPKGRPMKLGPEHNRRFSFCCAVDGCRKRETPPSLRFLGAKVYLAAAIVLIAIMRHGATNARVRRLNEAIPVARHTIERWRTWWRDRFTATRFWQAARAALMPPVDHNSLPVSLIERFTSVTCFRYDDADGLVALLRFIAPITGGRARAS